MIVTIEPLAERRLWALIRKTDVEIGGMGYAFLEQDGSIHWRETFLTPQEVSSSEVDFESTNGDEHFIERALKDGVLEEPNFVPASWHSHHTMGPYWSGTDDSRIAAMNKVGVKRLLSFVGCHDGTYKMRVDTFDFEAHGIYFPQVTQPDLTFAREPDEFDKQIADEFDEFVTVKKFVFKSTPKITVGANGNGKKTGKKTGIAAEEEDERRIVAELVHHLGHTFAEAESMMDSLGIEDCELLLNGGYITGTTPGNVALNGWVDP